VVPLQSHSPARCVAGDSRPVGSGNNESPTAPAIADLPAALVQHRTNALEAFGGDLGGMERHEQFPDRLLAQATRNPRLTRQLTGDLRRRDDQELLKRLWMPRILINPRCLASVGVFLRRTNGSADPDRRLHTCGLVVDGGV